MTEPERRGWSPEKRRVLQDTLYEFLNHCWIDSKDHGLICLGQHLYLGQHLLIKMILDGKEEGINDFYCLKSRQLGISTIVRAIIIFFQGMFPGTKGAIVLDTTKNREEARTEITSMIEALPPHLKFPTLARDHRDGFSLTNRSRVMFMSAGIKKSKVSGTLGRSVGLSMATMSELCSYDNEEGLAAFRESLSEINPNAIYINESTARGYNQWWVDWTEARSNPRARCLFLGWYTKPQQSIPRSDPDFETYTSWPPTPKEEARMAAVKERYGIEITPEQLAWIRRKMDPSISRSEDENPLRLQEQPWTEDEAFQQTGSIFFSDDKLTDQTNRHVDLHYQSYMFSTGVEFTDMRVIKTMSPKAIELKVWEEPQNGAAYVMGVDPAYGENEFNDRSCIQVFRCYADGVDQVAEYAWPLINTRQLAWVIAALLGWYGGQGEIRYILELNGPGIAVFNELRSLRQQVESAYGAIGSAEAGLRNIFQNVRTYIYKRPDAMSAGANYHFKTNAGLKVMLMERLRDFVSNGMLHVRSIDLVNEMRTIARDGDKICAPSSMKDDRVMAAAMAIHQWEKDIRPGLIQGRRTRASEEARQRMSVTDQVYLFQKNQLEMFFQGKANARARERIAALRTSWRGR